jgi:hypothetical protein
MECRKARYYLVASFDGPLAEDTQESLSYHLKDCRACRHEAFYYRELFAAEKQIREETPSADFNERLVAAIRMREAQAAWPQTNALPERRNRRRWQLAWAPGLFATAAVLSFVYFSRTAPDPVPTTPVRVAATAPQEAEQIPASPRDFVVTVRYHYGKYDGQGSSRAPMLFRLPQLPAPGETATDPFGHLVVSEQSPLYTPRPRQRTRYVLPVVSQTSTGERIY